MHLVFCALSFALLNAESNMLAKTAMMEITTSNSINVKPLRACGFAARPVRWHPFTMGMREY
jgi:hypothetical protein